MAVKKNLVVITLTIFVLGLFMAGTSFAGGEKIGFVELKSLFDNYEKTKKADEAIAEIVKEKQAERDSFVADIRSIKDEIAMYADGSDEKAKKEELIDQKIKELQAFDEKTREEVRQIRDENVKEIFDDINAVIQAYGDKKGYDFIIGDRALVYKSEKFNLTSQIEKDLADEYKK